MMLGVVLRRGSYRCIHSSCENVVSTSASTGSCTSTSISTSILSRARMSKMFIPTMKEAPSGAVVDSHVLMTRSGFIRQSSAGIYTLLPLAQRSLAKIEDIVDQEMASIGGQKIRIPALSTADVWKETGRWESTGPELFTLKDRKGRDFCLAPTCEEAITKLVDDSVASYKQLPLRLYQIEAKWRDEIRPRFGLLRGREFIMKDMYSFDRSVDEALHSYELVGQAYTRIFDRLGVKSAFVEADSGSIGGQFSHEFHVIAESGEDSLLHCSECSYAANRERAVSKIAPLASDECQPSQVNDAIREILTARVDLSGNDFTAHLVEFRRVGPHSDRFCIVVTPKGRQPNLDFVKVYGDNPTLALKPHHFSDLDHKHASRSLVLIDQNIADSIAFDDRVIRDYFALAEHGDGCASSHDCKGTLQQSRGIEVGHIFNLGSKYSEAMDATFVNELGAKIPFEMGCYGIGISRVLAAIVEASHDSKGIIWPSTVAPYNVLVMSNGTSDNEAEAERIYDELSLHPQFSGDVVIDDRNIRLGAKFKDSELIGFPFTVVIGRDFQKSRAVEVQLRKDGSRSLISRTELGAFLEKQMAQRVVV